MRHTQSQCRKVLEPSTEVHLEGTQRFPPGVYISVIKRSRTAATDTMVQLSIMLTFRRGVMSFILYRFVF